MHGGGEEEEREVPSQEELKEARVFVTEKRKCLPPGHTECFKLFI